MKLQNKLFIHTNFEKIFQELLNSNWNIKEAYALNKLAKELEEPSKLFDEMKQKIFEKYGTVKDEQWMFEKDVVDTVNKELDELLQCEFDVSYEKLDITETSDLKITPSDINLVEQLFEIKL